VNPVFSWTNRWLGRTAGTIRSLRDSPGLNIWSVELHGSQGDFAAGTIGRTVADWPFTWKRETTRSGKRETRVEFIINAACKRDTYWSRWPPWDHVGRGHACRRCPFRLAHLGYLRGSSASCSNRSLIAARASRYRLSILLSGIVDARIRSGVSCLRDRGKRNLVARLG